MATIAVIGPGAIGSTVAMRLLQSGRHHLVLCARSPLASITLETSEGASTARPSVMTSPCAAGPVDWVLIATKAHQASATAGWLPPLVTEATRVAILQNGVEHVARFSPYLAEARIVPVIVDLPVERVGPGEFRQRSAGHLTVADGADGAAFADLFRGTALEIRTTPDFLATAWRKLAVNCAGAVSALVLRPAAIAHDEAIAAIMRALVEECVAVGAREGAKLDAGLVEDVIRRYRNGPPDAVNSMHADRLAGRPIEIEARNGAVSRFGRRHGVATPVNDMIVALLRAASEPTS